jgi:hypothetical protein
MCAHCGRERATTRDHVFPRCIFLVQPNPPLLVPSCERCNKGNGDGIRRDISLDEDYFYKFLSLQDGTSKHPAAVAFLDGKIRHSFQRPETSDRNLFSAQSRMFPAINSSGVIFPRPGFNVRGDRINRVLTKMTRGLIYLHNNQIPIASGYRIKIYPGLSPTEFEQFRQLMTPTSFSIQVIGANREVQFIGVRNRQDPNETYWLMVFYERFVALTNSRRLFQLSTTSVASRCR